MEALAEHLERWCVLWEDGIRFLEDGLPDAAWLARADALEVRLRQFEPQELRSLIQDPLGHELWERFQTMREAFGAAGSRRREALDAARSGVEDSRRALRAYLAATRRGATEPHYIDRGY
jgi:hypothetical protein